MTTTVPNVFRRRRPHEIAVEVVLTSRVQAVAEVVFDWVAETHRRLQLHLARRRADHLRRALSLLPSEVEKAKETAKRTYETSIENIEHRQRVLLLEWSHEYRQALERCADLEK